MAPPPISRISLVIEAYIAINSKKIIFTEYFVIFIKILHMPNEENGIEYFITQTDILCETALKNAEKFKVFDKGIAADYFGRCLSGFNSIRTTLHLLNNASKQDDYAETMAEILKDILQATASPEQKTKIILNFIGSFCVDIRFTFFHSFYAQTEATFRILIRNKFSTEPKKSQPFAVIRKEFGIFENDFIDFVQAIRNTYHNNGFYFPNDSTKTKWSYTFKDKLFEFEEGKAIIEVSFDDLYNIVAEILNKCLQLFEKHPSLKSIPTLK